ncbi:MAG: tryptophan-rich sensory protein [Actinobacteria bacterium]|nr:tryptophan-rich sensory protein [Actinomycetota bacterium]
MGSVRIGLAASGIVTVVFYALGSGYWVSSDSGWYRSLKQPSFQPPDWIFGVIWPYNFIMLGIVSVVIARQANFLQATIWLVFFVLSVIAALTWSYLFYVPHNLPIAAAALVITAVLTLPMIVITFQTQALYGWLLLPYQLWVITASTLSIGYAQLN